MEQHRGTSKTALVMLSFPFKYFIIFSFFTFYTRKKITKRSSHLSLPVLVETGFCHI
uniref:Uncharacterized protein n=1 Tax=Macaca fascicularis TaxID=9541 RepID=A0A7N9D8W6_MACFA